MYFNKNIQNTQGFIHKTLKSQWRFRHQTQTNPEIKHLQKSQEPEKKLSYQHRRSRRQSIFWRRSLISTIDETGMARRYSRQEEALEIKSLRRILSAYLK